MKYANLDAYQHVQALRNLYRKGALAEDPDSFEFLTNLGLEFWEAMSEEERQAAEALTPTDVNKEKP